MGTSPRVRPQRLAEKLRYIRTSLNLTQADLMGQLAIEGLTTQSNISEYESGKREPSSLILLQYARLAGVHVENLIDDEEDLPEKLPGKVKHKRFKPAVHFRDKKN
ncbi:MAG TPA: helix-turn-helix transcriptional regulator [Pyrinomonadaceae bacterium]|jgi:transcriptional regulator with XRE-family HTH domain|nr:helix-turn-helix transcriptional regulator [Pyrinomonadaceae bacterium]